MKKVLFGKLSLLMLAIAFVTVFMSSAGIMDAYADDSSGDSTYDGFEYSLNLENTETVAWILKYAGDESEVEIPAYIPTSSGDRRVVDIRSYAFKNSSVKSVTIPTTVKRIRAHAFENCEKLESITIPYSVTLIEPYAFLGCSIMATMYVDPDNHSYDSRDNCFAIIDTSENELVAGCNNSRIPDGVEKIGKGAFSGCCKLQSIHLPDGLAVIGDYAFDGCSGLASISIPEGVTEIGQGAFYDCAGAESLSIPASVTSIGDVAFEGCRSLKSISVAEGNPSYDSRNNCNALIRKDWNQVILGCSKSTIPDGVRGIGGSAFEYCVGLKSISLPEGLVYVNDSAFEYCTGLESISLPKSLERIGDFAFDGCSNLKNVYYAGSKEDWKKIEIGDENEKLLNAKITFGASLDDSQASDDSKQVKPKATTITKLVKGKKAITVKWKKKSGVTGYQIQYSLKKNFKNLKKVTIKKASTTTKKITKLKAKKKYYVRIRTYKTTAGKDYYSAWSKAKSIKTK